MACPLLRVLCRGVEGEPPDGLRSVGHVEGHLHVVVAAVLFFLLILLFVFEFEFVFVFLFVFVIILFFSFLFVVVALAENATVPMADADEGMDDKRLRAWLRLSSALSTPLLVLAVLIPSPVFIQMLRLRRLRCIQYTAVVLVRVLALAD